MNYVINQGWCLYWGTAKWSHVEVEFRCDKLLINVIQLNVDFSFR